MLKRILIRYLTRYRRFMNEGIHAEFAALRSERRELAAALERLGEFEATAKAVEAGLLTMALTQNRPNGLPPAGADAKTTTNTG